MKIDKLFVGLLVSASGMRAQRKKMNAVASNLANIDTTRTEQGGPYRRKVVTMKEITGTLATQMSSADVNLVQTQAGHLGGGRSFGGAQALPGGIEAEEREEPNAVRSVYDPDHPDANAEGYVLMPNINVMTEMVDMIASTRAYEANVTAIQAAKTMAKDALEI